MVSTSMDIQDQSGGSGSSTGLSTGNGIPLVAGPHSVNSVQLKDQLAAGDDYAPKVRKPYTITKQRERWAEEEHKKFLEALKLYGRAWRRIEEHVGTKTAVQIRSHAQKFFSKVVRESSSSDANSVKPIEIPPPRPKRKPMHPYPRKVASPLKTGTHLPDQQRRSMSPNLSVSEQENQSPVSVLSAIGSDTELSTPNSSQSPVSSNAGGKSNGLLQSNPNPSPEENGSSSPVQENGSSIQENGSSTPDEQVPMKLELFPQENDYVKDGLGEAASTQSLKLFGKTVLVTDSHRPTGNCKLPSPGTSDERRAHWNIMPMKFSQGNDECAWNTLPCGAPAALYYMQFPTESSDPVSARVSCWNNPYGGVSFPFLQQHNAGPHASSDGNDAQEKELQKEVSWTGSNTGSVNVGGDGDKSWEFETQSHQPFLDKQENEQKPRFGAIFRNPHKRTRGFVPYKRCLAERETHSSTITGEEREELRIRLCL